MVYVLLGTGFEEIEAITPVDLLRRAGVDVITVGLNGKTVYGGHGIGIEADITVDEMDLSRMEMIVLPGGLGGVASIRSCEKAMDAIRYAHEHEIYIGAICAAPTILAELGITMPGLSGPNHG
jgi:4-methyl-5(b-hydroxyethyl)-thiazole monophosphate biosynthesis